jgi:hypothetical protein
MRGRLHQVLVAAAVLASLTGCTSREPAHGRTSAKERPEIVELRTKALAEAEQKRSEWQSKLKAMDSTQLASALEADSERGLEPFNSLAFTEAVSRGEAAGAGLARAITRADRSSLLTLLAVRKASPSAYGSIDPARRVGILVDALRTSKTFNTWGLPHVRWEYAAQAVIDEGAVAVKPLSALLTDKRLAPVWGSEDFLEYDRYKYRVCDYAWAMLAAIRNQQIDISADPASRDRQIAAFLAQLPR